jgi:hypothetical protein
MASERELTRFSKRKSSRDKFRQDFRCARHGTGEPHRVFLAEHVGNSIGNDFLAQEKRA